VSVRPPPPPDPTITKPKLVIGWIVASDLRNPELLDAYGRARTLLQTQLASQFPMFDWQMPIVERRSYAPRGSLPPLELLELGAQEKLLRRWDYALVLVTNELQPRRRISTLGVPSRWRSTCSATCSPSTPATRGRWAPPTPTCSLSKRSPTIRPGR
jgi:hypothetical protein